MARKSMSPPGPGFAGTPIARRTRHAARAIHQVVSGVVAAFSPKPARTKAAAPVAKAAAVKAAAAASTRPTRATGLRAVSTSDVN